MIKETKFFETSEFGDFQTHSKIEYSHCSQGEKLKEQNNHEFDAGYNLGVKEAKGEIERLRKQLEEIKSHIPKVGESSYAKIFKQLEETQGKLKIAVEALEFVMDYGEVHAIKDATEIYNTTHKALEKIKNI